MPCRFFFLLQRSATATAAMAMTPRGAEIPMAAFVPVLRPDDDGVIEGFEWGALAADVMMTIIDVLGLGVCEDVEVVEGGGYGGG